MIRVTKSEAPDVSVAVEDARFPAPFDGGLEYSAPARGTWNIVHTGMLIPGAHQIFVCAEGCLRGVVLTAAEMGEAFARRFSTLAVREGNVIDGDMETFIVEGVSDILGKLPQKPPAVLVYTSCLHHFLGTDLALVYRLLGERFPAIAFTDCYMNPIMRKSGLTPDELMRRQLYSLLDRADDPDKKAVHIAGNDFATDADSDLIRLLRAGGFAVKECASTGTFADYKALADAAFCVTTYPAAKAAGEYLERVYGQKHLHLPFSFDADEISAQYGALCEALHIPVPDLSAEITAGEEALAAAREVIGDTPVAIDYTAFSRPLGLARLLVSHGFRVERVYADGFTAAEKDDFAWLCRHAPRLRLYPTVHPAMRVAERACGEPMLAVGQKAAYFTGTDRFVNIVENGGLYGFSAVRTLAELMKDAFLAPKDARALIQIKGWGCACAL